MAYDLKGNVQGLIEFGRTLASVERGDYATAAAQMLQSKWAQQVGQRAQRLTQMMAWGLVPPELAARAAVSRHPHDGDRSAEGWVSMPTPMRR